MSTSKNGLDAFERSLRESLEQYEVPYNSADWTQMERSLNGGSRGWWVSGLGLTVLTAGMLVVGGATWYALNATPASEESIAAAQTSTPASSTHVVPTEASNTTERSTNNPASERTPAEMTTPVPVAQKEKPASTATVGEVAGQVSGSGGKPVNGKPTGSEAAAPVMGAHHASSANEITFKASVGEGCPGTSVDFKVSNMPEDGIYLWNFGDGSFSNQPNPEHTFTKPGRYQVMLSMSAAGVGTIENKPSSEVIEIHEAPMAAFNVLKQEYDGHLPSVHFENRSLAGEQYSWDFGDGQTSTIAHPDHIYKKKGVYQVELTVTNRTGCVDKVMKDVRIDSDYNLDAPLSFSPNGDDFQETFMPEALRTLGVKFNLTIYSSNGTLLYQTNDASKPWTGRPQNRGNVCGAGEYVWVVDVRESLHLAETYTGKVKLER